jgi:hypothetical protein
LEFQRSYDAIHSAADDDIGSREAEDLEVSAEFVGVPDLAVLGFQGSAAARLGIDLAESLSANGLGGIVHVGLLFFGLSGVGQKASWGRSAFGNIGVDPDNDVLTLHLGLRDFVTVGRGHYPCLAAEAGHGNRVEQEFDNQLVADDFRGHVRSSPVNEFG